MTNEQVQVKVNDRESLEDYAKHNRKAKRQQERMMNGVPTRKEVEQFVYNTIGEREPLILDSLLKANLSILAVKKVLVDKGVFSEEEYEAAMVAVATAFGKDVELREGKQTQEEGDQRPQQG